MSRPFPFLSSTDRADVERGRVLDPLVRAEDVAHVALVTPDLERAERFYQDFGLFPSACSPDAVWLRAHGPAHHAVILRRGPRARFEAVAMRVDSELALRRLASLPGAAPIERITEPGGGLRVRLAAPGGLAVHAVHGIAEVAPLPRRPALAANRPAEKPRVDGTQRPARAPAELARLGHVALETTHFARTLLFWMRTFGMIVSDFQWLEEAPGRGPVMAFTRCDRGEQPSDHHTIAIAAGAGDGLAHAAFETEDLDAIAAGGAWLRERGWRHVWGIGRHVLGSQLFDYWRDPDGRTLEHYADGDVLTAPAGTGRTPFRGTTLYQWGPPLPADFVGPRPRPRFFVDLLRRRLGHEELRLGRLAAQRRALAL